MSLVPAAIDGLVALVQRAAKTTTPSTPWQIIDGPPTGTTKPGLVCIAFTGVTGAASISEVVNSTSSAVPRRAEKVYEITSQISHYAGNGSIRAQRQACYDLVAAIEAALAADTKLGGAIQGSALWAGSHYAPAVDGGPVVVVEFNVRVQGFEV